MRIDILGMTWLHQFLTKLTVVKWFGANGWLDVHAMSQPTATSSPGPRTRTGRDSTPPLEK